MLHVCVSCSLAFLCRLIVCVCYLLFTAVYASFVFTAHEPEINQTSAGLD